MNLSFIMYRGLKEEVGMNRIIILTYGIDDHFLLTRIVGLGVHLDIVDHARDHGLQVVSIGLWQVN